MVLVVVSTVVLAAVLVYVLATVLACVLTGVLTAVLQGRHAGSKWAEYAGTAPDCGGELEQPGEREKGAVPDHQDTPTYRKK